MIHKILIVDDEPEFLSSLKRFLKREGFELETAECAANGIKLVDQANLVEQPFDLIITDIIMPWMNGGQFIEWVQTNNPDISIIVLTGLIENTVYFNMLRPKLDLHAPKTIAPSKLLGMIRQLEGASRLS